jgi:PASTA domain
MRVPSSRAATAALLIAALGVLLVAGRLLAPAPGVRPSSTTSATTTSVAVGISQRVRLPDLLGQRLAQATTTLHRLGLEGRQMNLACVALDHGNPADAVVVAQNPHAGESAPRSGVVTLCARTDVQPDNTPRRVRLGPGSRTAAYLIVAPATATHQLTVGVVMPATARVEVWLEPGSVRRLPVLAGTGDAGACRPIGGQLHCRVEFGALDDEEPGPWVVRLVKRSAPPVEVEVMVAFAPL